MDWFLHDKDLCHERVNQKLELLSFRKVDSRLYSNSMMIILRCLYFIFFVAFLLKGFMIEQIHDYDIF